MSEVHKCPVCNGAGSVPYCLYYSLDGSTSNEFSTQCKSCFGRGYLVINPDEQYVVVDGELAILKDEIPPALRKTHDHYR